MLAPTEGEVGIPVHQFMSGLAEYKRGEATRTQLVNAFNLSPIEETQLDNFLSNLDLDSTNREEIHDVLMLGERERYYTIAQVKSRLGIT